MKLLSFLILFSLSIHLSIGQSPYYFQQILDHFNPEDNRTFTQKYYYNSTFWWHSRGPIFLYIGGEGPVSETPNNYVVNLAHDFGALIVTLEHRFYGESQPFNSLSTENLRYLTTSQALEDLAYFIQYFSQEKEIENPWFTIGCSYAGALSAWFRLKYPHLTTGSLSSSGVVNAILEFSAFDEQVAESVGPQCAKLIQQTNSEIEIAMNSSSVSNKQVKEMFQASYLEDDDFIYMIADIGAETVQYGYQENLCSALQAGNNDLISAFANFSTSFWYPTFQSTPMDYYTIWFQNETTSNGDRAWWWQTCSELAYFQIAPSQGSLRSSMIDIEWFHKKCSQIFGNGIWPNTNLTNLMYGGADIAGTNIFFADSSQDPWRRASVQTDHFGEPFHLISCNNCGHCSDLRGCPSLPSVFTLNGCDDTNAVKMAREIIVRHIHEWLGM